MSIPAEPWTWPLLGPADPASAALVIIDMQVDFVRAGGWFATMGFDLTAIQAIVPTVARLHAAARRMPGLHVVHTRQGSAPDLSDLPRSSGSRPPAMACRTGTSDPSDEG